MSRKAIAIINLYILLIVYDTHLYSILSPHIRFLQIYYRDLLLFVSFKEMRRLIDHRLYRAVGFASGC